MDASAIDRRRVAQVAAAVGSDRYRALLEQLLSSFAGELSVGRLHRLAGSAGTLGLSRLAAALAAAEATSAGGGTADVDALVAMAADDAAMAADNVAGAARTGY